MTRLEVLTGATKCVLGEREREYGNIEINFQTIADLWTDYLSAKGINAHVRPADVACMMALLKIARIATGHANEDNWVDLAGYAACGAELEGEDDACC